MAQVKIKLNVGCGDDYKKGFINLDFNKEVKADIYHNLEKRFPFTDNEFDYILLDNVLEHIPNLFKIIDELFRISKPDAIIDIYVPHFSGIYASKHPAHFHQFGIGTFDIYKPEGIFNKERYGKARFKILKQELIYFHHKAAEIPFLPKLPINFLFNFSRKWQLILEKFFPLKFDEIHFVLQTKKNKNPS